MVDSPRLVENMLTIQTVADFLQVHYTFARHLIINGDLRSVSVGTLHRVAPAWLRDFCVVRGANQVHSAEPMLTSEQAAAQLSISRSMVLIMCRQGRLPAAHIGKIWRISPADLQAFVTGANEPTPLTTAGALGVAVGPSPRAGVGGGRQGSQRKAG